MHFFESFRETRSHHLRCLHVLPPFSSCLMKNLSAGVFAIPIDILIWQSRSRSSEGFPLITATTRDFHVKSHHC